MTPLEGLDYAGVAVFAATGALASGSEGGPFFVGFARYATPQSGKGNRR